MRKVGFARIIKILWDNLESNDNVPIIDFNTAKEWASAVLKEKKLVPKDEYALGTAVARFVWQLKYFSKMPTQDSIVVIDYDHAFLLGRFACLKHRVLIFYFEDENFIPDGTIACPICNKERLQTGATLKEYGPYPYKWQVMDDDVWEYILKCRAFYIRNTIKEKWNGFLKKFSTKRERRMMAVGIIYNINKKLGYRIMLKEVARENSLADKQS